MAYKLYDIIFKIEINIINTYCIFVNNFEILIIKITIIFFGIIEKFGDEFFLD